MARGIVDLRKRRPGLSPGKAGMLALAASGVSFLSYLPRFSVQDIRIAGAKEIRPEFVHSYVEARLFDGSYRFLSPVNIFLYPRARIEEGVIPYFPRLRGARGSRPAR